jgi:hypothetical protein
MKIRAVGAELFHADGRTDRQICMSKPIFAFRKFANVPSKPNFPKEYLLQCHLVHVDNPWPAC